MKTRFSRPIKAIGFYLAMFIVSIFLIETVRVIEAQAAINYLAKSAVNFASTGRYEICGTKESLDYVVELLKTQNISVTRDELLFADGCASSDDKLRSATMDGARYFSILKIIREGTPTIIDARYLKIVICTDHPDFTYDDDKDTCSPLEYPGQAYWYPQPRKNEHTFASLTYQYPVGSSLGLDLFKIRLHVFDKQGLERWR